MSLQTSKFKQFCRFRAKISGFWHLKIDSSKNPLFYQTTNACSSQTVLFFNTCSLNFEAISKTLRDMSLQTWKTRQLCRFRAKISDFWHLKFDLSKNPLFFQITNDCPFQKVLFVNTCSLNFEAISKTFRDMSLETWKTRRFCRFRANISDFLVLKIDLSKNPLFLHTTNSCSFQNVLFFNTCSLKFEAISKTHRLMSI